MPVLLCYVIVVSCPKLLRFRGSEDSGVFPGSLVRLRYVGVISSAVYARDTWDWRFIQCRLQSASSVGIPFVPVFWGHSLVFQSHKKYDIYCNTYKHFDFSTVGDNICKRRTTISQPLTGWNRRGRGRCVG